MTLEEAIIQISRRKQELGMHKAPIGSIRSVSQDARQAELDGVLEILRQVTP